MDAYAATILPILKTINTTQERELFEQELEKLSVALYKIKPHEGFLDIFSRLGKQTQELLTQAFTKLQISLSNTEGIKTYLTILKLRLEAMPVVSVQIALAPTQEILLATSSFVKETLGDDALIAFTVDPTLVAGAVISYKGKFFDASAKNQLSNVLLQNKQDILSLI
ncbi:MAG TPA: F0F1 ATP synthase subunit delta [Patescibacteria group bacterium]|nr:F0F1 ATP synthase subunit delta [Patescibacteria group bacterium]